MIAVTNTVPSDALGQPLRTRAAAPTTASSRAETRELLRVIRADFRNALDNVPISLIWMALARAALALYDDDAERRAKCAEWLTRDLLHFASGADGQLRRTEEWMRRNGFSDDDD